MLNLGFQIQKKCQTLTRVFFTSAIIKHVLRQVEIFHLRQLVLNLSNFINISNKYAKLFFPM